MPLWTERPEELLRLVETDQFRFLTSHDPVPYLLILVTLYRLRQQRQQLEVPFDKLLDEVGAHLSERKAAEYGAAELRADLLRLDDCGNVKQRLEPRRIRSLHDRGLQRYLVRLTASTHTLLEDLEVRAQKKQARRTSVRVFLRDVEDALLRVAASFRLDPAPGEPEELCRAGHDIERARASADEAADELLRLELWLGEQVLENPDQESIERLVRSIEGYLERYLGDLDTRRRRSLRHLESVVGASGYSERLRQVRQALEAEAEEDPMLRGRVPAPGEAIDWLRGFLKEGGLLDERCQAVHHRTADVLGHLERHLAALVRRSELRSQLGERINDLARLPDDDEGMAVVETFFARLWKSGHSMGDGGGGEGTRSQAAAPLRAPPPHGEGLEGATP